MTAQFIHLRIHSEFSIKDGMVKIKPLVAALKQQAMSACAITDLGNLFALVKFYRGCVGAGIKPIIGCEICLENEQNLSKPYSLLLLCQNAEGLNNLRCLISKAYLENQQQGYAQVKVDWLAEYAAGIIALSGGLSGDIAEALLAENNELAESQLERYQQIFPDRFYLEVQRVGDPREESYIEAAVQLAIKSKVPMVATNSVCFLAEDDFEAHEARVCIHNGEILADPKRKSGYSAQQYLRNEQEMQELFVDLPACLQNSVEITKRCNVQLELGESYLPNFPIPQGMTTEEFFAEQAHFGLTNRLEGLLDKQHQDYQSQIESYRQRLDVELKVINDMGFPGYFLIVADFIEWARKNDVPVGPGRGSGAGSLVAYAMGITDIDPMQYELLFERFLNPERVSLPDFDIDFCMDGRDRVIDYVAEKYGRDSVSQIITYGTMAAKAVVRDVGRVLDHPYGYVDKIAKLIPFEIGMTLDKALAQEEALLSLYNEEAEVAELIDLARKLEGTVRNAGKHAGGVVIAPSKLTDFTPLYCEPGGENIVSQFDKDDVETIGLVKFDFLGLRTLTIIDWAVKTINQQREQLGEELLDIRQLPVDDKASFELLKDCDTTAVFQLESRGMKDLIKRLKPDCFEEIIALVALFRPGPLQSGMVDDFIARKHGDAEVEYPHPDLEPILKPTYGVILYQEQVMQIAQVLANYTLGGADLLRRAMGKKKPEEMAKQRQIFTEGAVARDVDEQTATSIFDLMEKFAGYGFNKSHSAAYALVAYQTAWLKAHYPAEFMAAVLSSDMDNTEKVVTFYEDCVMRKIEVLAPNINQGFYQFKVKDQQSIYYGLGAIKGVGESVLESIVAEREANGPFTDLFEFCRRIDLKKANKRAFEALIRSGALDCFNVERAVLEASMPRAVKAAEQNTKNQQSGQGDMFSQSVSAPQPDYIAAKAWREQQRLLGERETLGIYFSGHPLDRYEAELKQFTTAGLGNLGANFDKHVIVAGFVSSVRIIMTKRGDRMAFVSLTDRSARLDLAVFSDLLQAHRELLVKDQLLVVEGEVSIDEYSGGYRMSCQKIMDIGKARETYAKNLLVRVNKTQIEKDFLEQLRQMLGEHRGGGCPTRVEYHNEQANVKIQLDRNWRVTPSDKLLDELEVLLGKEQVSVAY